MGSISAEKLRLMVSYDSRTDTFTYKKPPAVIFKSDQAWHQWCRAHVGRPVPVSERGKMTIHGDTIDHRLAVFKITGHTREHGLSQTIAVELRRRNLMTGDLRSDGVLLQMVRGIVTTMKHGQEMCETLRDYFICLGLSFNEADAAAACTDHATRSHTLPWRGRRAGETDDRLRYPWETLEKPGDSFWVPIESVSNSGAANLRRCASSNAIPVSVKREGDGFRVTRRGPGVKDSRERYPFEDLIDADDSFFVADDDLPSSGRNSILSSARARGYDVSTTRTIIDGVSGYSVSLKGADNG